MKRNVKKLLDAGVRVARTDAPYPGLFQGEALHHELELLVAAGMTPLEVIPQATSNAARLLHAEEEWGSLQAGSRRECSDRYGQSCRPHQRHAQS